MAIAFDNASTATATNVASVQWNHTAAGANVCVLAAFGHFSTNDNDFSAQGYGGVSMSLLGTTRQGLNVRGTLFGLQNAATGAQTISAIYTGGAGVDVFSVIGVSYANTSQATPFGGIATASAAASTLAQFSVSSTANNVCIYVVGTGGSNNTFTVPVTMTLRGTVNHASGASLVFAEQTATGAATQMSVSINVSTACVKLSLPLSLTTVAAVSVFNMPATGAGK